MRVWLDRDKLAAYSLSTQDVETAIKGQNLQLPSGRVESAQREFAVLVSSDLQTAEQFRNIVVKSDRGTQVHLGDVARVELGPVDERVITRLNGEQAVTLAVVRNATANPLDISRDLKAKLPEIEKGLPDGMSLQISYDTTLFISESIKAVQEAIFEAVGLVVLVILFFLRSFRATLIPLIAIPISLIGTCAIMYASGFSINTLTLLAFVLAIGLVVDDAIVVLENISRYLEEGLSPLAAALKGSREIVFAIIGMTITLAAVFTPIAFSSGITGKLFTEFALTLAGAVLVSGLIALTLTPVLCAKILKGGQAETPFYKKTERYFVAVISGYRRLLTRVLDYRAFVAIGLALAAGLTVYMMLHMQSELAPLEDRNIVFSIISGPDGATIDYTSRFMDEIEAIYAKIPERLKTFTITGARGDVSGGFAILTLKPWSERSRSQFDITNSLFGQLSRVTGVNAFPTNLPSLGQRGLGRPVSFVLQTTGSYDDLQKTLDTMMEKMTASGLFLGPDSDLRLSSPQLRVDVDRDKILSLGLKVEDVAQTLQTMLAGRTVTRFERDGKQYDVIVKVADSERTTPSDISRLFVKTPRGDMVQLANIVAVKEAVQPRELNHFNKLRSATISANLSPGVGMGAAVSFLQSTVQELNNPALLYDYAGQTRDFVTTSSDLIGIFVLGLFFIYLVLAAQFESFIDPLIILLSVPLALFGAIATLFFFGGTLNIYSQIGLLSLIGLLAKHGILIVEFANHQLQEGKDKWTAVVEAASLRLRPILMTTFAMVLGAFPLAFARGAGAMSQRQIGLAIVGGLSIGTILTLFVVPSLYVLLKRVPRIEQA